MYSGTTILGGGSGRVGTEDMDTHRRLESGNLQMGDSFISVNEGRVVMYELHSRTANLMDCACAGTHTLGVVSGVEK